MKVVFIGVHNKPRKPPLCSTTLSGSTIDAVIAQLNAECVKVNLYSTEYIPKGSEQIMLIIEFLRTAPIEKEDIAVLLGYIVQYTLAPRLQCKLIRAAHPSLQYSKVSRPEYIQKLTTTIQSFL